MSRRALNIRATLVARFTAAVDNYADEIGARFARLLEPFLRQDETIPDLALALRLLSRMIRHRFENAMSFYRSQLDESAKTLGPVEEREQLAAALREKMVDYRRLARAAYGRRRSAEIIPIDGNTPVNPQELFHHGAHSVQRLLTPTEALPPVKVSGVAVDPSHWAEELGPLVEDLGVNLGLIERKRGQVSGNVADKEEAKKDLDFVYSHCRDFLRAMFFLTRMPSQGKSLPALRRQRRSRSGPDPRIEQPGIPDPSEPRSSDTEPSDTEPSDSAPSDTEPSEEEPSDGEAPEPTPPDTESPPGRAAPEPGGSPSG